jgi:hypothetical protein
MVEGRYLSTIYHHGGFGNKGSLEHQVRIKDFEHAEFKRQESGRYGFEIPIARASRLHLAHDPGGVCCGAAMIFFDLNVSCALGFDVMATNIRKTSWSREASYRRLLWAINLGM